MTHSWWCVNNFNPGLTSLVCSLMTTSWLGATEGIANSYAEDNIPTSWGGMTHSQACVFLMAVKVHREASLVNQQTNVLHYPDILKLALPNVQWQGIQRIGTGPSHSANFLQMSPHCYLQSFNGKCQWLNLKTSFMPRKYSATELQPLPDHRVLCLYRVLIMGACWACHWAKEILFNTKCLNLFISKSDKLSDASSACGAIIAIVTAASHYLHTSILPKTGIFAENFCFVVYL